jgi:hypothetical protein
MVESPEPERVGAAPLPLPPPRNADHTLRWTLLFTLCVAATLVLTWGSAKVACNYHPPQSQKFKEAPLDKLITRPQDAVLQFQHSLFVQDYERARSIASGDANQLVEDAMQRCDAACQAQRAERVQSAYSRATLFKIRGSEAWGKVETFFAGQVQEQNYALRREGRRWTVVGTGEPPPDPPPVAPAVQGSSSDPPVSPSAEPLPSGSAAAVPSGESTDD